MNTQEQTLKVCELSVDITMNIWIFSSIFNSLMTEWNLSNGIYGVYVQIFNDWLSDNICIDRTTQTVSVFSFYASLKYNGHPVSTKYPLIPNPTVEGSICLFGCCMLMPIQLLKDHRSSNEYIYMILHI